MQKLFEIFTFLESVFIEMKTNVILIENIANSSLSLTSAYQNDDERWFQIFRKQLFRLSDDFQSVWTWFRRLSLRLLSSMSWRFSADDLVNNLQAIAPAWRLIENVIGVLYFCKLKGLGFKSMGFALHDVRGSSVNLQQQRVLRTPPLATSG